MHTTANTGDTTSNLVGLTMLGVVARVHLQIALDAQLLSIVFAFGYFWHLYYLLGTDVHAIPPPYYKGGWMKPLPGVFDMLRYFKTVLPLMKSL